MLSGQIYVYDMDMYYLGRYVYMIGICAVWADMSM